MLSANFKLQFDGTILSLQYCKLVKEQSENAEEWMGHLRIKANEYRYKEKDRRLKEQFINGINNEDKMTELPRELMAVTKTSEITS